MIASKITQTFLLTTLCGLAVNATSDQPALFSREAVSGEHQLEYVTNMVEEGAFKEEGTMAKEMGEEISALKKLTFMGKIKNCLNYLLKRPTSKKSYYLLKDGVECKINVKDFTGLYVFKSVIARKTKEGHHKMYNQIYYRTKNTKNKIYERALVDFRDGKHLRQIQERGGILSFVAVKENGACPATCNGTAPEIKPGKIVYEGDFVTEKHAGVKYYHFRKYIDAYYKQEDFTTELDEDYQEYEESTPKRKTSNMSRLKKK